MEATYTNAEKLAAVVEAWAGPRLQQLLPDYGALITSALRPVVLAWVRKVPDESVPTVAAEVVTRAKANGGVRVWKVEIDRHDLAELEELLRLNLPAAEQPRRGYEVKRPGDGSGERCGGAATTGTGNGQGVY